MIADTVRAAKTFLTLFALIFAFTFLTSDLANYYYLDEERETLTLALLNCNLT